MVRKLFVGLLAGVLAVVASVVPAQAISGGATADPSWAQFAIKINIGGEHPRACTGAMVEPQWAVTAASCFAVGDTGTVRPGPPDSPTTATVGRLDLTSSTGQTIPIDTVVPHPERDVALVRLALVVSSGSPITVSMTAPSPGELLAASGYGRTDDTWVPDELAVRDVSVVEVADGTFGVVGHEDPTTPSAEPPFIACQGDAGGPVTRAGEPGAQPELIGLLIGSTHDGCLKQPTGPGGATVVRLDGLGGWTEGNTPGYQDEFLTTYKSMRDPDPEDSALQTGIGGYDFQNTRDHAVAFDFDHSGKQDHLLMYRAGDNIVHIAKRDIGNPQNPGDDRYVSVFASLSGIGGYNLNNPADRIVPFDYDHDGLEDDLAIYRPGAERRLTILTHGQGTTFTRVYAGPWWMLEAADAQLLAYDFDHDGMNDDLFAYRPGSNHVSVITKGSGAGFMDKMSITAGALDGYTLTAADRVVAFDFEHTGKADDLFVYRPGASQLAIFTHTSGEKFSKTFSTSWWMFGSANAHAIAYDYDHDGRSDDILAYRSGESGHYSIISKGPGAGFENKVAITAGGIGGYDLAVDRDRLLAFDSEHVGSRTNLLAYRPRSGIAWVMDRADPPLGSTTPVQRPRDETSVVEGFAYPLDFHHRYGTATQSDWGTDEAAARNFELISGDGHIVWASCSAPVQDGVGVVKVRTDLGVGESHQDAPTVCFKVLGDQGHVTVRIPNIYEVRGDGTHDMSAVVENQIAGQIRTKHVESDESQQFGWSDSEVCDASDPDFPEICEEMLLELRVAG